MPLKVTFKPGTLLPAGTNITRSLLRRLGLPTFTVEGTLAGTDIEKNSISTNRLKLEPLFLVTDAGTGSANTYVLTGDPAAAALASGLRIAFMAKTSNTGAVQVNLDGLGLRDVRKYYDQALASGDIKANQLVELTFDAANSRWQMQSPVGNAPAAANVVPSGVMMAYGGVAAPSGWLLCDGTDYDITAKQDLYNAIGLNYSNGFTADSGTDRLTTDSAHGLTTQDDVKLGNVGGALPAGVDTSTTYYVRVINTTVVTLHPTAADAANDTNRVDITTAGTGRHTISRATKFRVPDKRGRVSIGAGTGTGLTQRRSGARDGAETHALTKAQLPAHVHTYDKGAIGTANTPTVSAGTGRSLDHTSTNSGDGSGDGLTGAAHNNMQPFEVDSWIIKE